MFFLGLEWNNNLVGHENPSCPGRMNTLHEQETSIIYVTYVCTAGYCLTKGMARVARPCPRESAAKAGKVMRRRVGKVQMQHRWHRRVLCRLLQHAVLCAVFFCCRREWSAKKVLVLWALGRVTAPHAHRTARPTHALHNALREHGLTTAVKHRSHTQQQQQQHS